MTGTPIITLSFAIKSIVFAGGSGKVWESKNVPLYVPKV